MRVKICGVTTLSDAVAIAALRPDYIGLNFYPRSLRYVEPRIAQEIAAAINPDVEPVGVFVNASADEIRKIAHTVGLRTIQLHGDEPPELLAQLREFSLIRAFRVDDSGLAGVAAYIHECETMNVKLPACLIDAKVSGAYGGTGQTAPWDLVRDGWRAEWPPVLLAGGLTPANVAEAVRTVAPWGVDVAGGVESSPGIKDLAAVRDFIASARGE